MKTIKESLNKLISSMFRQGSPERSRRAHHERSHLLTVRPELVEGLNLRFLNLSQALFCLIMLGCALRPLLAPAVDRSANIRTSLAENWAFSRWHGGGVLTRLPLTSFEKRFAGDFPGAIARFTDGETVWVVRHLNRSTRKLHPAFDCFRSLGYAMESPKVIRRNNGTHWRCFFARKHGKVKVCERIFDAAGGEWTDVSAWYWNTAFQSGAREWWAVTEVTRAESEQQSSP